MGTKADRRMETADGALGWLLETAVPWMLVAALGASLAVGVLTLIRDLRAGTPALPAGQHAVCDMCGQVLDGTQTTDCVPEGER